MKYLILDYCRQGSVTEKEMLNSQKNNRFVQWIKKNKLWENNKLFKHFEFYKKFKIYQQYKKYLQYKQLCPIKQDISCCNMEFVYVTIPMLPKELSQLSPVKVQDKLQKCLAGTKKRQKLGDANNQSVSNNLFNNNVIRLLAVQPGLESYVPYGISVCEDVDEVYIMLLKHHLQNLCDLKHISNTSNSNISKRNARLLFIDDSTKDAMTYIKYLSQDWNYVSVCSNRHEELEELYRQLYEEEGLMVQCVSLESRLTCQGDVVIDITSDWKGLHHIYPIGSYVLDTTFSSEKKEYLAVKKIGVRKYIQVGDSKSLVYMDKGRLPE